MFGSRLFASSAVFLLIVSTLFAADPPPKKKPAGKKAAAAQPAGPLPTDEAQATAPQIAPREGKRETIELFNGKDLTGWIGHKDKYWSVKDGVIIGRNTDAVPVSTYLLTERKFSDFRLILDFKLNEGSEVHSGVAFWGRLAPEQNDPYTYAGHLVMFPSGYGFYDLYGRKAIHRNGDKARPVGKQHDWNHIEILAQGNRIRFVLNGVLVSDWREPDPATIKEAPIGLQLHSNPIAQQVEWKNITLETFPEDKLKTVAAVERSSTKVAPVAFAKRAAASPDKLRVYLGAYTRSGKSEGIYRAEFDPATGQLSAPVLAAKCDNPSFLAIAPSKKYLYACGEFRGPKPANPPPPGNVYAFAIDPSTGDLTALNQQSSGGPGPCHIAIDKAGKNVLVANYTGGSCGCLPVRDDGSLGPMSFFDQHTGTGGLPGENMTPRGHSFNFDPANRYAVCCDLGLDRLFVYRFDAATGKLTPNEPPFTQLTAGVGPRHFAFHPSAKFGYAINERACTVTALNYDAEKGILTELQTISTLPAGETAQKGYSTAEVVCHPSGKFLYGSNRGQNSIVTFKIDEATGKLTLVGHQSDGVNIPRNFNLDPSGGYCLVANQAGDDVEVFTVNQQTGALETKTCTIPLGSPSCIKFMTLE